METTSFAGPSFAGLGLSAKVLAAVEAAGYTTATPIQTQAIPVAVTGRDVLGIAQTGTGKTAAFVMPMITRLETGRARARMPRSLILAPTRELAAQVAQSFEKYGVNNKLALALLIGGMSMDEQTAKLDRGVDVLIATPGRLLDHFGRGRVMLMGVEILVIDEADRMLDMGFIPDIEKICKLLPPKRQTLFFSATMPPEITRLVNTFLIDPVRIEVAKPATAAGTITQRFRFCPTTDDWEKREILREMIRGEEVKNAIIFCNRKRDVAILLKSLQKHGFNAGALHGDMDQTSRMATLDAFRTGKITFLAASDVAARGLDIPDVSHIFNFDVPWQADDYIHRIGRTGRAGKLGSSSTIVTPDDFKAFTEIEKMLGESVIWLGDAPTPEDIAEGAKRKRGRGGRFSRGASSSGRERPAAGGRDRGPPRDRGDRPDRPDRPAHPARPPREERPAIAAEAGGRDGARRRRRGGGERPIAAGIGDQPKALAAEPAAVTPREQPRDDQPRDRPQRDRPVRRERPRHEDAPRDQGPVAAAPIPAPAVNEQPPIDQSPAPRQRSREPRPPRGDQGARTQRQPRPEARPPREDRADARPAHRNDNDRQVEGIGFADNIPAFLRRPARAGS